MYSRFHRRQRPKPKTYRTPQPPGADIFIYGDDYSLAGFVFERRENVLRPVDKIPPIILIDNSLGDAIAHIASERKIDTLIVPPNAEKDTYTNHLYSCLPAAYSRRTANNRPGFAICCEVRAVALDDRRLIENDYAGAEKLLEQLRQCREDKPPTALLWAYLMGLYELLSNPPINPDHFYIPKTNRTSLQRHRYVQRLHE